MIVFFTILLLSIASFVSHNEQLNALKARAFLSNERCDRPLAGWAPLFMEKEKWKDISGYEGIYQVSSLGRVRGVPRIVVRSTGTHLTVCGRLMKLSPQTGGYLHVLLWKNNKQKIFRVHKLVYCTFNKISIYKRLGFDINHKNRIRQDNRLINLEGCSRRENICHGVSQRNTSSQFIGVHWNTKSKKWRSVVYYKGKSHFFGQYSNEADAAKAYKIGVKKLLIVNRYAE